MCHLRFLPLSVYVFENIELWGQMTHSISVRQHYWCYGLWISTASRKKKNMDNLLLLWLVKPNHWQCFYESFTTGLNLPALLCRRLDWRFVKAWPEFPLSLMPWNSFPRVQAHLLHVTCGSWELLQMYGIGIISALLLSVMACCRTVCTYLYFIHSALYK